MPKPPFPPNPQHGESLVVAGPRLTWRIRDSIQDYRILRGHELTEEEVGRVVPAVHLVTHLGRWLASPFNRSLLHGMYEVVSRRWMDRGMLLEPATQERIRYELGNAFRIRYLVALLDGPSRLRIASVGAGGAGRNTLIVPLLDVPPGPRNALILPAALRESSNEARDEPLASDRLQLVPVIFDAHMHIMSGNCTPFPVAYYTQIEPVLGSVLRVGTPRKVLNKVGKKFNMFMPFLGWSPRNTLVIGEDTVKQNDHVYSVFRKSSSTPELRGCEDVFLGISIVLTMDMDLCHLDGYKGQEFYTLRKRPGKKKPVYTYNIRLTGEPNERLNEEKVPPSEWGLFEDWGHQLLRTKMAATEHPLRLIPMFHYEPRRYSEWTGSESSFDEVSLCDKDVNDWREPFGELATKTQPGLFAGFKMYTSQAYQPIDPNVPSLAKFFQMCAEEDKHKDDKNRGIPIMTHCTPAGHFTHDRRLYIDLDSDAKARLSQADRELYSDAGRKRDAYLDARERATQAEEFFEDYCDQHYLPMDPKVYESPGWETQLARLKADPAYWKAHAEYQEALDAVPEKELDYERAARLVRKHEDMAVRYERAGGDLQKMAQDPPLRLKYFKEKHLHPEAWRPLLERHPSLRLCLAHFASDSCLWWHYLQDDKAPCWDLDDVPYEKNWVTSIVELCEKYDNFYTDISFLPLMRALRPTPGRSKAERKLHKNMEKKKSLPLHWQGLAKVCENKFMLRKIMFGTDWYMILNANKGYAEWHKETLEGLALIEKHLEEKHLANGTGPQDKDGKYRKLNLFYQFAVVNPMRFYRLPLIADSLKEGIEDYMDSAPLWKDAKEKHFARTKQRLSRNHALLMKVANELKKVESVSGEDSGLLYSDMFCFDDRLTTS